MYCNTSCVASIWDTLNWGTNQCFSSDIYALQHFMVANRQPLLGHGHVMQDRARVRARMSWPKSIVITFIVEFYFSEIYISQIQSAVTTKSSEPNLVSCPTPSHRFWNWIRMWSHSLMKSSATNHRNSRPSMESSELTSAAFYSMSEENENPTLPFVGVENSELR